jgi:hypothetical protein
MYGKGGAYFHINCVAYATGERLGRATGMWDDDCKISKRQ